MTKEEIKTLYGYYLANKVKLSRKDITRILGVLKIKFVDDAPEVFYEEVIQFTPTCEVFVQVTNSGREVLHVLQQAKEAP
jgi:hypothetical protein